MAKRDATQSRPSPNRPPDGTGRHPRAARLRRVMFWSLVCILATLLYGHLSSASDPNTPQAIAPPQTEPNTPQTAPSTESVPAPVEPEIRSYGYKVIRTYPHDKDAFTQGLVYQDGYLYEGTGLYGKSVLTKRELETGKLIKTYRLPRKYFGEGITLFGDKLLQLTWKSRVGFRYDKATFRPLDEFTYQTQGWGVTHDGQRLIQSDGTSTLRFYDPNTYAETGRLRVWDRDRPIRGLNELEFIDGAIYANVLPSDYIAIIAPKDGRVAGWIDLRGLYVPPEPRSANVVLNGIAYLPESKHLLVTGKYWPKIYEIELTAETQ